VSTGELHPWKDGPWLVATWLLIHNRLGWADPYPSHAREYDNNNEQDGRLTIFTKYDTFAKITKVMHLKDFALFNGRPKILSSS
jgi:hypothetical protein